MRYLLFFLTFLYGLHANAQRAASHLEPNSEKYYSFDSNTYFSRNDFASIKDTLNKIQQAAEAVGDSELALSAKLYNLVKGNRENIISSDTMEYHLLAIVAAANGPKLSRLKADALQALGDLYSNNNLQQSEALEQYILAYSIYKDFDQRNFPRKQSYINQVGQILYKYQDYKNSITYLGEALLLKPVSSGPSLLCPIANTLGLCYRNLAMYDSAVVYFQFVRDAAIKQNEQVWVGIADGNIGITYFHQKKYDLAEPLLKNDIEVGIAKSNLKNAANSMVILAMIYVERNKYDQAEKLLLEALGLCYKKKFWRDYVLKEKLYGQLGRVYGLKNNYRLSYLYADSALTARDSADSMSNAITLSKSFEKQNFIRKKLENERIQNEARIAKMEEARKYSSQQQLLYLIIIGFLVAGLVVAVTVNRFRARLKNIATNSYDAPEIVVQKMSIVIISIATCAASVVWALLYYYYYGARPPTFGPVVYLLVTGPSLAIYFFTKKQQLLITVQLFCMFTTPVMMEWTSGGFQGGVVIFWAFLAPIGALMYKGTREAAIWMVLLVIAIICTIVFSGYFSTFYAAIPDTAQRMLDGMNILGPAIIIFFSMQFYVKSVIRDGILLQKNNRALSDTLGELKIEKQKSDDLLLNILPEEVAGELKATGTTTARHFDNVTVLFTDFVNFTSAGERMTPQDLVDELHTCFKAFDEITGKYGIEKIKTVGDAYLAVAGLPTIDERHAENVVRAAIDINSFMQDRARSLGKHTFEIRIGIHSGSAVAGIVGVKKFAYDIWGDTVNTAARMEQNSEAGRINISQTTYELVKDIFTCVYRGEIEAKGKGQLKMYFIS